MPRDYTDKPKSFVVRLSPELYAELADAAKSDHRSLNSMALVLIERGLKAARVEEAVG